MTREEILRDRLLRTGQHIHRGGKDRGSCTQHQDASGTQHQDASGGDCEVRFKIEECPDAPGKLRVCVRARKTHNQDGSVKIERVAHAPHRRALKISQLTSMEMELKRRAVDQSKEQGSTKRAAEILNYMVDDLRKDCRS